MKIFSNTGRKHFRIWFFLLISVCILLLLSYILHRQSYNDTQGDADTAFDSPADTATAGGTDMPFGTFIDINADNTNADITNASSSNTSTIQTSHSNEQKKEIGENENHDQNKETEEKEAMTVNPDRVTYCEGFFYEPLSDEIIRRIQGISYHENPNISYDDLCYLSVLYCDFENQTQTGEIICNRLIAQDLLEIFKALYDASYQIEKIRLIDEYQADDDLSCADNNTSCFNYRVVAGSDTLSKHALGMAIDINPFYNPYITYPNGNKRISPAGSELYEDREGGYDHMILKDDLCYRLFTEHGFTWGGEWKSIKDYQHFQKVIKP